MATNTAAIVFLDKGFDVTNGNYASDYRSVCVSATSAAAISCDVRGSEFASTDYYYYPVMKRIIINSAIDANAFNHYLLV